MPSVPIWMGELSGGRSADLAHFFEIDVACGPGSSGRYSQIVWTALDQRNWIGAPQLGQFALL